MSSIPFASPEYVPSYLHVQPVNGVVRVDWSKSGVDPTDSSQPDGFWKAEARTTGPYPDDIRFHQNTLGFGYGGTTLVRSLASG